MGHPRPPPGLGRHYATALGGSHIIEFVGYILKQVAILMRRAQNPLISSVRQVIQEVREFRGRDAE